MILTRLIQYYQSLLQTSDDAVAAQIPLYGFSEENIGAILVLSAEGKLVDVRSHMLTNNKNQLKPKRLIVPQPVKRTSGIQPNFLWDKSVYVLGVEAVKDPADEHQPRFTIQSKPFNAFRQYHIELLKDEIDQGLRAVYLFLQQWQPAMFADLTEPQQNCIVSMNLVFMLDEDQGYIHQRHAARDLWLRYLARQQPVRINCLTDGLPNPLAMLHPPIKHVYGASSLGVSMISFNQNAFASYGKKQGHNAPVAIESAFAYTTALNYLLNQTDKQCCHFSDLNIVFWTHDTRSQSVSNAEILFRQIMNVGEEEISDQDKKTVESTKKHNITRFCVLGLVPNAARLAVRFWIDEPASQIAEHLMQYKQELGGLAMSRKTNFYFGQLLYEIAPYGQIDLLSPKFIGELITAILTDKPYPMELLSLLMTRIGADRGRGKMTLLRLSMIQAILQRRHRLGLMKQNTTIKLDKRNHQCAYLLGRLFAVLAHMQHQLIEPLYSDIVDRYYGMACTTPALIFPRLLNMYEQQWLALTSNRSIVKASELLLKQLLDRLPASCPFPSHLNLIEQGQFTLGYGQQRRAYATAD
ncbi:type I-C CRISPR-associated protein Cas8c/Csd1 [Neisseriaceae bacterium ESL0693]|nr:type I-C CRISPR-associated protein Cas8c/Csd1 [Neisseriaceae bacterium ESL0693]